MVSWASLLTSSGCLIAAGISLWVIQGHLAGTTAAFAGTLVLWLLTLVWFGLQVTFSSNNFTDEEEVRRYIGEFYRKSHWVMMAGFAFAPGLWIGLLASAPLPVVILCLLVFTLVTWLNEIIPGYPLARHASAPAPRMLRQMLVMGLMYVSAAVVGTLGRTWLYWR